MAEGSRSLPLGHDTQWVEMCDRRVPRSIVCQLLRLLDRQSLSSVSMVSRTLRQMANDPAVFNSNTSYSGPNSSLPELQKVVPFPPPAMVGTTLPSINTVNTAPDSSTSIPAETAVFMPVLPEAVPMFAQVPDVVMGQGDRSNTVQISQVLPGYAPSYATDYVPPEVNEHSFSAFANTMSFNVSRYPTLSEVVDSKAYSKRKSSGEGGGPNTGVKDEEAKRQEQGQPAVAAPYTAVQHMEYVPAEYFRGEASLPVLSVSCVNRVDFVKPDVLASGRLLTNMTSQAVSTTATVATVAADPILVGTSTTHAQQNGLEVSETQQK